MTANTARVGLVLLACLMVGALRAEEITPLPPAISIEAIRLQVADGIRLASASRAAVSEYYYGYRRFPPNNAYAGQLEPYEIRSNYVSSIAVANGVITITYGQEADPAIAGRTVRYEPSIVDERVVWACLSDFIEDRYLPEDCQ